MILFKKSMNLTKYIIINNKKMGYEELHTEKFIKQTVNVQKGRSR